ncbi:MAG: hypothetical protein R3F60_06015 [bacterium]
MRAVRRHRGRCLVGLGAAQAEGVGHDGRHEQGAHVVARGHVGVVQAVLGAAIHRVLAAAEGVAEDLGGHAAMHLLALGEAPGHLGGAVERPVDVERGVERAAGVHGVATLEVSPAAHGVVVLEGEAHRIDELVAALAGRPGGVLGEALAGGQVRIGVRRDDRHVGRRRRQRVAEDVLAHEDPAPHGRGDARLGRHGHQGALGQDAGPLAGVELDAPQVGALDAIDPVELRQPVVEEGERPGEEVAHVQRVVPDDGLDELAALFVEQGLQVLVKEREIAGVLLEAGHLVEPQPLLEERPQALPGAGVGEHPPGLVGQVRGRGEGVAGGGVEEVVIGHGAPEQVRQP